MRNTFIRVFIHPSALDIMKLTNLNDHVVRVLNQRRDVVWWPLSVSVADEVLCSFLIIDIQ